MDLITSTDLEVCSFLASQIRVARRKKGYTQAVMAKKTGIALRTYKRIELTGIGSIKNLIVILRVLERIRAVEILFPQPTTETRPSIVDRVRRIAESEQQRNQGAKS